jgi:hypothetical protein
MVSSSYTETSPEIIDNRPDEGLILQRSVKRSPYTKNWNDDNERNVEFVQVLPPIGHRYGLIGDMGLVRNWPFGLLICRGP